MNYQMESARQDVLSSWNLSDERLALYLSQLTQSMPS
jgi:hypothetical protein